MQATIETLCAGWIDPADMSGTNYQPGFRQDAQSRCGRTPFLNPESVMCPGTGFDDV